MKPTLLIVDDELDIREMLSRHFRFLDYVVETAGSGSEALHKLSEKKFDIIISDIMMPEMTGVELLKAVRKDYPMVKAIMITGHVTLENALACMRYGAESCIFKPLNDLSQLDKAVVEAAAKVQYWVSVFKELRGMK